MASKLESATTPLLPNDGNDSSPLEEYGSENEGKADSRHVPVNSIQATITPPSSPRFVYFLAVLSAIGGFLFGYDTGVVSGAMLLIKDYFKLNSVWQELVVSATVGAAAVFAFLGGFLNDFIGRKMTIIFASIIFTLGAILMGAASNVGTLLAGRIIVGVGIGLASMTVPMYIAEAAPTELRGKLVILNNMFITGGQFVACLFDGIFSFDRINGWRYMLGLAGLPSVIQFIGFLFMPESPRWLVSKGRVPEAKKVLIKIRATTDVTEELEEIVDTCQQEHRILVARGSTPLIIQVFKTAHVRRALILGCGMQMIQQLSGINTVMYYSASIIRMAGIREASMAIWLAAVTAFVNFLFTGVGLLLVERAGRRSLSLGSLAGTCFSLVILGITFQAAAINSPDVTFHEQSKNMTFDLCSNYSLCNNCMQDPRCGFCYLDGSPQINGSCVAAKVDISGSVDPNQASYGRCDHVSLDNSHSQSSIPHGPVWVYDFCPTQYAWTAIIGLVLYLMFFASGMGSMPWTVNTEIYPLWARSTGNSLATATNWICNLLISMTFLTLTEVMTRYGAFYLYSSFAFLGFIFLYIFLPETKGKSLEQVEDLFRKPWCGRS